MSNNSVNTHFSSSDAIQFLKLPKIENLKQRQCVNYIAKLSFIVKIKAHLSHIKKGSINNLAGVLFLRCAAFKPSLSP